MSYFRQVEIKHGETKVLAVKLDSIGANKRLLHESLSPLINRDYVLYDIPNHRNIGDQLIYQGELDLLKSLPFACRSTCCVSYNFETSVPTDLILLHGGGNFGDIYPFHQNFREGIVKRNPGKEIILFPNSVQFNSEKAIEQSSKLFNAHSGVTICARDEVSYATLKHYFYNCNVLQLPDMAFCSSYRKMGKPNKPLLIIKRKDLEIQSEDQNLPEGNYDVLDWITFQNTLAENLHHYYYSLNLRISKIWLRLMRRNSVYGCFPLRTQKEYIEAGIAQLSNYEFVISTRLHGHILALLLGIPSILVDNNYGKNSRYYNTWLRDMPNSYFAKNVEAALALYQKINTLND